MDNWDLIHSWFLVLPPSRPSAVQLAKIRALVPNVAREESVAVLGSTPEFRDLAHELGFKQIYVLERNGRFYDQMSHSRIFKNSETLVRGDWLDTLEELENKFAVILSDLTSGNIPYDQRRRFYALVSRSLKGGGIFFDKVLTHTGPNIPLPVIFDKYQFLPLNLQHINHFSCEALFCSELCELEQIVDSSSFYSILDNQIKDERVRAFMEHAKLITPPGCRWWYGRKWEALKNDYCPELKRVAIEDDEASSPYFGRLKHFVWMKGD